MAALCVQLLMAWRTRPLPYLIYYLAKNTWEWDFIPSVPFQPNFKWTLMIMLRSMYFNEPMQYRAGLVPQEPKKKNSGEQTQAGTSASTTQDTPICCPSSCFGCCLVLSLSSQPPFTPVSPHFQPTQHTPAPSSIHVPPVLLHHPPNPALSYDPAPLLSTSNSLKSWLWREDLHSSFQTPILLSLLVQASVTQLFSSFNQHTATPKVLWHWDDTCLSIRTLSYILCLCYSSQQLPRAEALERRRWALRVPPAIPVQHRLQLPALAHNGDTSCGVTMAPWTTGT